MVDHEGSGKYRVIAWKEPSQLGGAPGRKRGGGVWSDITRELRSRPGHWALLGEQVPVGLASRLRVRFEEAGFEFTLRGISGSTAEQLFGRYREDIEL